MLLLAGIVIQNLTQEAPDVSKTKQPPEGDSKGADPAACGLQTGSERVDSFAQRKMFFSVVRQTNLYWVQTGYIYIYIYISIYIIMIIIIIIIVIIIITKASREAG